MSQPSRPPASQQTIQLHLLLQSVGVVVVVVIAIAIVVVVVVVVCHHANNQ